MINIFKEVFFKEGITRFGIINIKQCDIINERILPADAQSALIFCIPYRSTKETSTDGFSEYARIYDYHKFSNALYNNILEKLNEQTGYNFYGFCDHSPINEKLAAAKCGLGVIGRNSLFIDNEFGSYIFLGSLLTNAPCENIANEINFCINCGKCIDACPNNAIIDQGIDRFKCLSGISQKKNKTDEEKQLLKINNIVWGCDICQNVCPYNEKGKISPIPYFKETRIDHIDKELIQNLSNEDFNKYAFSYKGRKIVLDNIDFI